MPLRRRSSAVPAPTPTAETGGISSIEGVLRSMAAVDDYDEVIVAALNAMCDQYGWDVGCFWRVDDASSRLVFASDCRRMPAEAVEPLRGVTYRRGEGLAGRAWADDALAFAPDFGPEDTGPAAAGMAAVFASSICLPMREHDEFVGVLQLAAREAWIATPERLATMRTVGEIVCQSLSRVLEAQKSKDRARDMAAVNEVLREVTRVRGEEGAVQVALDTIRRAFGWEYGSFWAVDPAENVLRFSIESGSAGNEFRDVTQGATFAPGVGLAGRTWRARDLVFEPDLGLVTDCVRAPAAQRAGVKAGVCLPIVVEDEVVGTMDFFTTRSIVLTSDREEALRNTAFLVSNSIERSRASGRVELAGRELLTSITEVERNVREAGEVAADAQRLTQEASRIVASLNTSSVEIGNVVKVITSIAEQTNLLALNATIEAARAGDAGKGFAVVANEVKDLARETAKATEEVDSKVSAIQSDAGSVVHALQGVAQTVERINEAQNIISGVLTEQSSVTRSVLGG